MKSKQFILTACALGTLLGLAACTTLGDADKNGKNRRNPVVSESGPKAPGVETAAIDPNADINGANKGATDVSLLAPHAQVFHFPYDDASLQEEDKPSLQAQGAYLKSHQHASVLLAGHTDERGSREYNVALGERRAQTVAEYLRVMGVSPSQIRLVSYGKEKPIAQGHHEAAWAQNRRVGLDYEATS